MACAYQIELPSRITGVFNPPLLIPYTHRRTLFLCSVGRLGGGVAYPPVTWVTGMSRCGNSRKYKNICRIHTGSGLHKSVLGVPSFAGATEEACGSKEERDCISSPPDRSMASTLSDFKTNRSPYRSRLYPVLSVPFGPDAWFRFGCVGVTPDNCVSWVGGCAVCAFCSRPEVTMPACAVCARANEP